MRIGLIASAPRGGLLHYAAQLADGLAARGHDAVLLTARGNELDNQHGRARMRAVLPARSRRTTAPPKGWRYEAHRAGVALRVLASGALTVREARQCGFDVVLLVDDLDVSLAVLPMLVLRALPRRPVLAAICHEPRPRNRWAGGGLYREDRLLRLLLGRLYRTLDVVFVHGARSRQEFEATWPPAKAQVIPHGNERMLVADDLQPAGEERILFFGDWRRGKGLPELMRAFESVRQRRPDAKLTIAGTPYPDADPDAVRAWAQSHGEAVSVIDHYVPIEQVPELFGQARAIVTPYIAGSQSGVVHLAMSFGRAVVASDAGELPSTVHDGRTGLIVPRGDVERLAAALERIVADPVAAERMGRAAREQMLHEADWDVVAARVEQALLRVRRAWPGSPP